MNTWLTSSLLLAVGLVVLAAGGEMTVKGAARLARRLGVSALAVGLTIVAYGTSAPEVAVSVLAALQGEAEIAVGNVVGSNIANILLILGLAVLARPLKTSRHRHRQPGGQQHLQHSVRGRRGGVVAAAPRVA